MDSRLTGQLLKGLMSFFQVRAVAFGLSMASLPIDAAFGGLAALHLLAAGAILAIGPKAS